MFIIDILTSYWGLVAYVIAAYVFEAVGTPVLERAYFKYWEWSLARADRNRAWRKRARPGPAPLIHAS